MHLLDSHLYFSCGNFLYSYNTRYYYREWEYDFKHAIGLSSPVYNPRNNSIIISTSFSIVASLNSDGQLQWSTQLELNPNLARNTLNTPILDQRGNIYVTNAMGKLYVLSDIGEYIWGREPIEVLRIFSHPIIPSKDSLLIIECVTSRTDNVNNQPIKEDVADGSADIERRLKQSYQYSLFKLVISL